MSARKVSRGGLAHQAKPGLAVGRGNRLTEGTQGLLSLLMCRCIHVGAYGKGLKEWGLLSIEKKNKVKTEGCLLLLLIALRGL